MNRKWPHYSRISWIIRRKLILNVKDRWLSYGPGGGYEYTSDREAEPIAIQMNGIGYRTPCRYLKIQCKASGIFKCSLSIGKNDRIGP